MPKGNPKGYSPIPLSHPTKQRYLDWLCTPVVDRVPRTQKELAVELVTTEATLSRWKQDAEFLEEWTRRYRATVGNPEKQQSVLEALYRTAVDRDDPKHVQAAAKYLEAVDGIKPKQLNINVTQGASELTDDQLMALLADRAAQEFESRHGDSSGV